MLLALMISTVLMLSCRGTSSEPQREESSPRRVVSLAPSLTEIIVDIGGASQLVGISSYGRVPPGVEKAKRVGGFIDPSIEHVISLSPDLVIGVPLQGKALESCASAGLRTLEIECQTLEEALIAYSKLGETLGRVERSQDAEKRLRSHLDAVRAKATGRQPARTLLLLGRAGEDLQQVYPVSPGNFGDQLLVIAGGTNVLEESAPSISVESVIALAPEVIIELAMDETGDHGDRRLAASPLWKRMSSVPAVRDDRVFAIASSSLLQPGPAMADGARLLYRLLHEEP
jgi:iron complex transport system substrate-binding protein